MFNLKDFVLNKLVPALRSEKYKQTKQFLRNEDGHCCLGVACESRIEEQIRLYNYIEEQIAKNEIAKKKGKAPSGNKKKKS